MQGLTVVIRRDPPNGYSYKVALAIPGIAVPLDHPEGNKPTAREALAKAFGVAERAIDKVELFEQLTEDDSTPAPVIIGGDGQPLHLADEASA